MHISHISQCMVELDGLYQISHLSQYDISFVPFIDSGQFLGYPGFLIHSIVYEKHHIIKESQSLILTKVVDLLL